MPLKLNKGVPISKQNEGARTEVGQTYRKMQIGESFDIAIDKIRRPNLYQIALYALIRVTVRTVLDEKTGKKIYRVWRIE